MCKKISRPLDMLSFCVWKVQIRMHMFISASGGVFEVWITSQYTLNMLSIEMNYKF